MDQKKKESNVIVTRYNDELYHWKYIKKVKTKNGKWRYIYDRKLDLKYSNNSTEHKDLTNKNLEEVTNYHDTNDMLDRSNNKTIFVPNKGDSKKGRLIIYKERNRGVVGRAQAKGEKWVYNTFLKKNSTVKKATKAASSFLKNSGVTKVTANGKSTTYLHVGNKTIKL